MEVAAVESDLFGSRSARGDYVATSHVSLGTLPLVGCQSRVKAGRIKGHQRYGHFSFPWRSRGSQSADRGSSGAFVTDCESGGAPGPWQRTYHWSDGAIASRRKVRPLIPPPRPVGAGYFAESLYEVTDLGLRVLVVREDIAPADVPQPFMFGGEAAKQRSESASRDGVSTINSAYSPQSPAESRPPPPRRGSPRWRRPLGACARSGWRRQAGDGGFGGRQGRQGSGGESRQSRSGAENAGAFTRKREPER